jgi:hypothetical protein
MNSRRITETGQGSLVIGTHRTGPKPDREPSGSLYNVYFATVPQGLQNLKTIKRQFLDKR